MSMLADDQVQLEAVEPAHGALAKRGDPFEDLVGMGALAVAGAQCCRIDKGDPCGHVCAECHLEGDEGVIIRGTSSTNRCMRPAPESPPMPVSAIEMPEIVPSADVEPDQQHHSSLLLSLG